MEMDNLKKTIKNYRIKLARMYRRARLKNKDFTIISNECTGAFMYRCLNMRLDSPTCDMTIGTYGFLHFCKHLKEYLSLPIEDPTEEDMKKYPGCKVPIGILRGENGLPDVGLVFTHYKTLEEAREKWYRRRERVHYDNLFITVYWDPTAKEELLDEYEKLPYNKVIFTTLKDKQRWKDTFQFSFQKDLETQISIFTDKPAGPFLFKYLDEFDFVKWLNRKQ